MSNGKGSTRRPAAVTEAEQQDRWHQTFGPQLAKPDRLSDTVTHDHERRPPLDPPPRVAP